MDMYRSTDFLGNPSFRSNNPKTNLSRRDFRFIIYSIIFGFYWFFGEWKFWNKGYLGVGWGAVGLEWKESIPTWCRIIGMARGWFAGKAFVSNPWSTHDAVMCFVVAGFTDETRGVNVSPFVLCSHVLRLRNPYASSPQWDLQLCSNSVSSDIDNYGTRHHKATQAMDGQWLGWRRVLSVSPHWGTSASGWTRLTSLVQTVYVLQQYRVDSFPGPWTGAAVPVATQSCLLWTGLSTVCWPHVGSVPGEDSHMGSLEPAWLSGKNVCSVHVPTLGYTSLYSSPINHFQDQR